MSPDTPRARTAKPGGGALVRLFEVGEGERREFCERVRGKTLRIRRAVRVQDGHSLGEQLVLTTLWGAASAVEGRTYRRISIGYRTLSSMCGLTVNNCKANLKSLEAKLAIETETGYSSTAGTTYRVFGFAEILRNREAAGLTHVMRSKGSRFVNPETGAPVTGTPPVPVTGTPLSKTGRPGTGEKGIPGSGAQSRIKKEEDVKEPPAAAVTSVSAAIRKLLPIDDAAVDRIVTNCISRDSAATPHEIAHFTALKIYQHRRNPSVQNLAGLLIRSVPDYFRPGSGELADFRAARVMELAREREEAQRLLDDPQSTEDERRWAGGILSVLPGPGVCDIEVRNEVPTSPGRGARQ